MARRAVAIAQPRWPGTAVAVLVLALFGGALAAVALAARAPVTLGAGDWAAIRFTLVQAALSSGLSVLLAVPVARALARRRFLGRGALITLLGAPFILPVIVAILGLLAIFGRGGLVNAVLVWAGLPPVSIYGLHGVVLAHVFFNLPLSVRLILLGWQSIPAERFRLAASLNAPVWRHLERPMLGQILPGIALVVFLICLTSFAVALTLGGGPRATTIELAIYQALRFDFDLGKAALLAAIQFGILAALWLASARFAVAQSFGLSLDRPVQWPLRDRLASRLMDAAWIGLAALFLLAPLGVILVRGAPALAGLPAPVWEAAARSLAVALGSTALAVPLALALALRGGRVAALAASLPLAASTLVLGTGLFIIMRPFVNPTTWALSVTALVNACMGLPFAYRALAPEVAQIRARHGRLAETLAMPAGARLRWLWLPRLRRPLGFAAGMIAALSMGDLGVIALFSANGQETLPMAMYNLMGAYRMQAAGGAALLLLGLSLGLFWAFDRGGRGRAEA